MSEQDWAYEQGVKDALAGLDKREKHELGTEDDWSAYCEGYDDTMFWELGDL